MKQPISQNPDTELNTRLANHPLFTPWIDPISGVRSFILSAPGANLRQVWYFVTPCLDLNAQLLWFHAAHPPAAAKHLGVVSLDPDQPWLREFPAAAIESADPLLIDGGRAALSGIASGIWRCDLNGTLQPIAQLDDRLLDSGLPGIGNRPGRLEIRRLATHLTQRPNGHIVVDPVIGGTSVLAEIDPVSGTTTLLHRFERDQGHGHWDHAQASPVHPHLTLIAQDWDRHPISGAVTPFRERLWIHNAEDHSLTYLTHGFISDFPRATAHEWWIADGRVAWCHYTDGVFACDPLQPGQLDHVWARSACHAHCDAQGMWWACDDSPYRWAQEPCQVLALHRPSGQEVVIASALPQPPLDRPRWHIDPHPQVSPGGECVVYTTTVRGRVELAVCPLPM